MICEIKVISDWLITNRRYEVAEISGFLDSQSFITLFPSPGTSEDCQGLVPPDE